MGDNGHPKRFGRFYAVAPICYLLSAIFFMLSAVCFAAFQSDPEGARPAGLSGAYAAVSGDVQTLFFNPAGLSHLENPEISMQYGRLLGGLDDGSRLNQGLLAFAHPLRRWKAVVGIGFTTLQLSDLYKERSLALSISRSVWGDRLAAGLAIKQLHVGFGTDRYTANALDNNANAQIGVQDPVLSGGPSRSALGVDAGLIYRAAPWLDLGLAGSNLNGPDLGILEEDKVKTTLRLGAAAQLGRNLLFGDILRRTVLESQPDTLLAVGYEYQRAAGDLDLAVRAGGRIGSRGQRQVSLGLGVGMGSLRVDYALGVPLSALRTADPSHRMALTYRFGRLGIPAPEPRKPPKPPPMVPTKPSGPPPQPLPAVPTPKGQEAEPPLPKESEREAMEKDWTQYENSKAGGTGLNALWKMLEAMRERFEGTGLDMDRVEKERERIAAERKRISSERKRIAAERRNLEKRRIAFENEWARYKNIKSRGAEPAALLRILDEIKARFEGKGVDMKDLDLERMRVLRQ